MSCALAGAADNNTNAVSQAAVRIAPDHGEAPGRRASVGGAVEREDLVAGDVARVVVQQATDRVGLAGHRLQVVRGHAVRRQAHVDAERPRTSVRTVGVVGAEPSASSTAAVFSGTAGALKASVCGKISAQARPCAMWWRVPSG